MGTIGVERRGKGGKKGKKGEGKGKGIEWDESTFPRKCYPSFTQSTIFKKGTKIGQVPTEKKKTPTPHNALISKLHQKKSRLGPPPPYPLKTIPKNGFLRSIYFFYSSWSHDMLFEEIHRKSPARKCYRETH